MENKDRSIFRKNIGRALLNKNKDAFIKTWELDLTTKNAKDKYLNQVNLTKQKEIENKVTNYIQNNFFFVVFEVNNKKDRLDLESKIISTVSLCDECKPSIDWLGNFSTKEKIKQSGLWLVNELYKEPLSLEDISYLRKTIEANQ